MKQSTAFVVLFFASAEQQKSRGIFKLNVGIELATVQRATCNVQLQVQRNCSSFQLNAVPPRAEKNGRSQWQKQNHIPSVGPHHDNSLIPFHLSSSRTCRICSWGRAGAGVGCTVGQGQLEHC